MAKKRKNALPKRVGGLKVPKALRRGRAGRLLASSAGQALVIEMAARAGEPPIGREAKPGSAGRKTADRSQDVLADFGDGAAESSAAVVYALRQAARAFVTAMQAQQAAARAEGGGRDRGPEPDTAGRDAEPPEKKDQGERSDRRTAH